jgi:hypothetical protein
MSVPAVPRYEASDTRIPSAVHTLSVVATAPWHEADRVTDWERAHGYEPHEELIERVYADLLGYLAAYGPALEDWPRRLRRGAWAGTGPTRVRQIFWLALRDGLACRYCRRALLASTATIDHLTPVKRGGTNAPDNLGLACMPCNGDKGIRTEAEYRQALAVAA